MATSSFDRTVHITEENAGSLLKILKSKKRPKVDLSAEIQIDNVVVYDITAYWDIIAKAQAQGFKVKIRRNKIVMKIPRGYFKKCAVNFGTPVEVK